eukprot:m.100570 g.100570  ORF g.100570 m.100570 type:complete len:1026 (-) comp13712_c2_seq4:687-3764(-)
MAESPELDGDVDEALPPPLCVEDFFGDVEADTSDYAQPDDATLLKDEVRKPSNVSTANKPPIPTKPKIGVDYRKVKDSSETARNRDSSGYEVVDDNKGLPKTRQHAKPPLPPRPSVLSKGSRTENTNNGKEKEGNYLQAGNPDTYLTGIARSRSGPPRPATMYDALDDDDSDENDDVVGANDEEVPPTPPPRKWRALAVAGGRPMLQNRRRDAPVPIPARAPTSSKNDPSYMNKVEGEADTSPLPSQVSFRRKPGDNRIGTSDLFSSSVLRGSSLEKSGFLLEHKKFRWKKRWIVLRDGEILIFNAKGDEIKGISPVTIIQISQYVQFQVVPSEVTGEPSKTFEIIDPQKSYRMQCESPRELEAWMTSLNLGRSNIEKRMDSMPKLTGWLVKVRHGWPKKRWCVLVGRTLFYYKSPSTSPLGSIRLGDSSVTVQEGDDDSDVEGDTTDHYSIAVKTFEKGVYIFQVSNSDEHRKWLFFMQMASGKLPSNAGTETEQALLKLNKNIISDLPECKTPVFRHTSTLSEPLTTVMSEEHHKKALELWKSIQLYTSVPLQASAADYHVLLAQGIIEQGLHTPELHNEIYCQLIKQTSYHPDPESQLHMQCWQLLTLCIPIFLPSAFFLRYLELHVARSATLNTPTGKMALYAASSLQRHLINGGRKNPPSRAEVVSIVVRKPYEFSHPLSAPVLLATGGELLAGFDASTTFEEFARSVSDELGMRKPSESGFAIFTSIQGDLKDAIASEKPGRKICDALYDWEKSAKLKSVGQLRNLVPDLIFQRRLYFAHKDTPPDHKTEEILVAYQTGEDIMSQKFLVTLSEAIQLGSILAFLEAGALNTQQDAKKITIAMLHKYVPARLRNPDLDDQDTLNPRRSTLDVENDFATYWRNLSQEDIDPKDLGRRYLQICKQWRLYGASLARARVLGSAEQDVYLAIHENGIEVLDQKTFSSLEEVLYKDIQSFGGPSGKFRILYKTPNRGPQEVVFEFSNNASHKEMTYRMTAYINAIVRNDGVTCTVASIQHSFFDK